MKIKFVVVGKTIEKYLQHGEKEYIDRLKHYCKTEYQTISELKNAKNMSVEQIKEREGELILSSVEGCDLVVLLDEGGTIYSSEGFAEYVEKLAVRGLREVAFVVGGAYGFSTKVYERAQGKLSLSRMTFSHQMVRLLFLEQLYRAHTIIKGQPYHHR
ncbi:MAG: 23S rRNA (pseudouridine(1915)-N(3))-methyltransferase RlmH [Rikenellaceae bacterium]